MSSKVQKSIEKLDYWPAIEILEREEGERGESLMTLGHLYRGVGDMAKARECYRKAQEKGSAASVYLSLMDLISPQG